MFSFHITTEKFENAPITKSFWNCVSVRLDRFVFKTSSVSNVPRRPPGLFRVVLQTTEMNLKATVLYFLVDEKKLKMFFENDDIAIIV